MYYLIQKDSVYFVIEKATPRNYDAQYRQVEKELIEKGASLHGQFGRRDYAEKWAEYYNTGGYKVNGAMRI
jgi:hypothetical protein